MLLGLALLAWWVIKFGLRPLEHMQETAGAIAAGDLSRRIDIVDEHTEVGRLGLALNEMMQQIETAFAARAASEGRLRRFVGDASHELRTPLTSIRGYAELFRRGAADRPEDLAKAMRRIEEEADRMGSLVDDMLLLARLDQGRPLERQPVDLTRITRDAVDDARAVAPDRPIDYSPERRGLRARRRGPPAPGARQPAAEREPPHAARHAGARARRSSDDDEAMIEVADEGPGMADRGREPRVRTVLALRPVAHPHEWRRRPRSRDRRRDRGRARRPGRGAERARSRLDVPRAPPAARARRRRDGVPTVDRRAAGADPADPDRRTRRSRSLRRRRALQADDELAEVVAGEQAHQRFGRAVDAFELVHARVDLARRQPLRELRRAAAS